MKTSTTAILVILIFVPCSVLAQLSQLLLETLKQNPSLIASLQSNPELLKSLLSQRQQGGKQQPVDQCSALRKQNKVLKQMIFSVTGSDPADLFPNVERREERLLNPTEALLQRVAGKLPQQQQQKAQQPSISLKSQLITPSATWTTSMTTTSYITTVTHTETSEVPIILRGKKVITTILESGTQVVTATEIKTSSILVTPDPTWSIETVTITPTPQVNLLSTAPVPQPLLLPQSFKLDTISPKKRRINSNSQQEAKVVEINQKSSNNDFKSAYGAFFASSAQRSADRFGDVLRPARHSSNNQNTNPLFGSQDSDYDYYDDFDQQWLAAQNSPVYVESPGKSKVFTLYFSGTQPGQFTTKLTRLPVDANGQPVLSRNKREDIQPSRVEPIESTEAPFIFLGSSQEDQSLESSQEWMNELDSSMIVVTVTQTVTKTESCSLVK